MLKLKDNSISNNVSVPSQPGARFSKVLIINGPVKLFGFIWKIEVSFDFFFRLLLSNCLNWKIYCDDHSSLSSTTAVQKWIISYTSHHRFLNSFASNMIKLSVNETKWSSLLVRSRIFILYILIWIFDFGPEKLPGLTRSGPQIP